MNEVKQITVQNDFFGEAQRAFAMTGSNMESLTNNLINYADLSQSEKEVWDAFVMLIKSKV
jgi:hypothetical protein